MPFLVTCQCGKKLRVADENEGKKVRCPACQARVVARAEPAAKPVSTAPREDADNGEAPPKRPKREEAEDEAPARPQRKKAARDDDDEDDRPAKKAKKKGSKPWLWVGCGCGSLSLLGCAGVIAVALATGGRDSGRATAGGPAAGPAANQPRADGLTVADVPLDAKGTLPCLFWADAEGNSFWTLDENGKLSRISYPDLKPAAEKDLGRKVAWLSPSAEGLLVTVADKGEVWVVDPAKLEIKKTIPVPGVKRAVSAAPLSVAAATGEATQPVQRPFLTAVDLRTGQATPFEAPKRLGIFAYSDVAAAPDGKSVFALQQGGDLFRCHFEGGQIKLDEQSGGMGNGYRIQVSPDSKYVCVPSPGGNPNPANKAYATLIFPTTSVRQSECVLEQGGHPHTAAFDPAAGLIYANNDDYSLLVFTMGGVKKKEYKVGENLGSGNPVRQYLVHPTGKKLLLLGGGKMYHVKVPD
jgi:DNA-directed RNA polymerase subunit RPC12/RpoP